MKKLIIVIILFISSTAKSDGIFDDYFYNLKDKSENYSCTPIVTYKNFKNYEGLNKVRLKLSTEDVDPSDDMIIRYNATLKLEFESGNTFIELEMSQLKDKIQRDDSHFILSELRYGQFYFLIFDLRGEYFTYIHDNNSPNRRDFINHIKAKCEIF